jgi:uncharacterized cupredoxin-like copper-binding protein
MVRKTVVALGLILTLVAAWGLVGLAGPRPAPTPVAVTITVTHQAEFAFEPREVRVRVGQPVTLTLINNGRIAHDMYIDGLRVHVPARTGTPAEIAALVGRFSPRHVVNPGQRSTVTFTPTRRGRFEFWCLVPGHKEAGMTGVLIVER